MSGNLRLPYAAINLSLRMHIGMIWPTGEPRAEQGIFLDFPTEL